LSPFLISSSLIGVTAQRLVRKICPYCKIKYKPHVDSLSIMGLEIPQGMEVEFYRGQGCDKCQGKGYLGRTALQEVMVVDEEIKDMILRRASSLQLKEQAQKVG